MKNNLKSAVLLLAGVVVGTSLGGPAAHAAAEYFQAQRSNQPIYVDGKQVQLEAYGIDGHNYVKLRDIGEAVGFEVYWDGSAVQILSDRPYTGEPPQAEDYSQSANPTVFTADLTREVYNAIREAVQTGQTTSFGSAVTGFQGLKYRDGNALLQAAEQELQQLQNLLTKIGLYPNYELVSSDGEYICQVKYSDTYIPVEEHTRDFINSLTGLNEREKVKRIVWYVCDRIAYDQTCYAWPHQALTQDGVVHGACMSYAYSVQCLCQQAGIPCLLICSDIHQWNLVYAEGRWWDVDATANDCDGVTLTTYENGKVREEYLDFDGTDIFRERFYVTADRVLWDRATEPYLSSNYIDVEPEITEFAKEILASGSSR